MQLDQTTIEIRERGFLELLDLALCVTRRHAGPLALCLCLMAVPLAVLNYWLLLPTLAQFEFGEELSGIYGWRLWVLMVWEAPLATAPMTIYLGQVMFGMQPRARDIAARLVHRLPQLIVLQGIIRGWPAALFVLGIVYRHGEVAATFEGLLLFGWWGVFYAFFPFLNEIILLEGNPLLRGRDGVSTFGRVRAMHKPMTGELLVRAMLLAPLVGLLFGALYLGLGALMMAATLQTTLTIGISVVLLPIALWLVGGFLTVARFLNYLDARIRSEGWEVELILRAEGERIAQQLA